MFKIDEQKLIEALGLSIVSENGMQILKNQAGLSIGTFTEDTSKKEKIYEFIVNDNANRKVTVCLKIGDTVKLGFMDENEIINSFAISNKVLELITSFKNDCGGNHLLIRKDPSTSLQDYLGTNYVFQAENLNSDNLNQEIDSKVTFREYQTLPDSSYQLRLRYKNYDGTFAEKEILKQPIRLIIENDKAGRLSFQCFRDYANNLLKPTCDVITLLMQSNIEHNDVFASYIDSTKKKIPDFAEIKELGSNILFGIVYEGQGLGKIAHGILVYDLTECFDLGYIDQSSKCCFAFDDQYIFRVNRKGKVEQVFDFLNKIEVTDEDLKAKLYKDFKNSKLLKKKI